MTAYAATFLNVGADAEDPGTFGIASGTWYAITAAFKESASTNHEMEVGTASPSPTISGKVPTAPVAHVVTPDVVALTATGNAPRRGEIEPKTVPLQFVYVIGLKLDGQPLSIDVTVSGDVTREPSTKALTLGVAGNEPTAVVANVATPGIADPSPTITGYAPTAVVANVAIPDVATPSPTITGYAPEAVVANLREPAIDELVLGVAGNEPTASVGVTVEPTTRSVDFGVAGSEPTIIHDRVAAPDIDTLVLGVAGSEPTIIHDRVATPGIDTLVIDEKTPNANLGVTREPATDELVLGVAGNEPSLIRDDVITVPLTSPSPTITGYAPITVVNHVVDSPAIDTLVLGVAGSEPTLVHDRLADVPLGTLVIDEKQADRTVNRIVIPDTVGLVIDEKQADREVSGGDVTREPSTVGLALGVVGSEVTILHDRVSIPDVRSVDITGNIPLSPTGHVVLPTLETLSISEQTGTTVVAHAAAPGTVALSITGYAISLPGASATIEISTGSLTFTTENTSIFYRNGTFIENPDATTDVPVNFVVCDYSGFKQIPGSLRWTWRRHAVRRKSWESRHPQERARRTRGRETQRGPRRPEQGDVFLDPNRIPDPDDF
jgi:hypothetical protein